MEVILEVIDRYSSKYDNIYAEKCSDFLVKFIGKSDGKYFYNDDCPLKYIDVSLHMDNLPLDGPWMQELSQNETLTPEILYKYKDVLDWKQITINDAFDLDFIDDHPDLPWRFGISTMIRKKAYRKFLKENPVVTKMILHEHGISVPSWFPSRGVPSIIEYIIENIDQYHFDYEMHQSKWTTPALVAAHMDYEWRWDILAGNDNFDWCHLAQFPLPASILAQRASLEYIDDMIAYGVDVDFIACNCGVTIDIMRKYPNIPWQYSGNISIDDKIATDDEFHWDWSKIWYGVRVDHLVNHPNIPWNMIGVSRVIKLTTKEFATTKIAWDYQGLLHNPYTPWTIINYLRK